MHLRIHARRSPPRRPAWTLGIWSLFWGCIVSSVWSSSNVASSLPPRRGLTLSTSTISMAASITQCLFLSIAPLFPFEEGTVGLSALYRFNGHSNSRTPLAFQVMLRVGKEFGKNWIENHEKHRMCMREEMPNFPISCFFCPVPIF